jgi:hypothetical protein
VRSKLDRTSDETLLYLASLPAKVIFYSRDGTIVLKAYKSENAVELRSE